MKTWNHRWMIIALCATSAVTGSAAEAYRSRSLNPYHERQIEQDIYQTASKVQACTDAESRSKGLQELCKKLIQAEKFDEALKIADQVHRTPGINNERKAAHHFLVADIYARKMDVSPTIDHMKQNRQLAMRAAQDVINQKYPAKWGVTSMANALLRDLEDPKRLARVQDKIQKRQANGVDAGRANLAQRQLQYMESMAKGTVAAGASGISAIKRTGSGLFKFGRKDKETVSGGSGSSFYGKSTHSVTPQIASAATGGSAKENVSLPNGGQVTFSQQAAAGNVPVAVNSPWSIKAASNGVRAPIIIDGASVRRSTPVQSAMARTELPSISGDRSVQPAGRGPDIRAAASASSTYAAGETPVQTRRN